LPGKPKTPTVTSATAPDVEVREEIRHTGVVKTVQSSATSAQSGVAPDLQAGSGSGDGRTRDRVARLLLELGPSTATTLGERLGLSPAAIRRHLDAMVDAGVLTARTARPVSGRGRGRPAKTFALTDAGHAAGPVAYDELATGVLRFLAQTAGPDAVADFATARAAELEERLRAALDLGPTDALAEEGDVSELAEKVAEALSTDGYAAGISMVSSGAQLCQHHCPVQDVAREFPQLCEAETAMLSRLLGTHVQRLATLAHGDEVCTTHIPAAHSDRPLIPLSPNTRTPHHSVASSGRTSS
jgi:predicted ArsR family transcriptional regulator